MPDACDLDRELARNHVEKGCPQVKRSGRRAEEGSVDIVSVLKTPLFSMM